MKPISEKDRQLIKDTIEIYCQVMNEQRFCEALKMKKDMPNKYKVSDYFRDHGWDNYSWYCNMMAGRRGFLVKTPKFETFVSKCFDLETQAKLL